MAIEKLRVEIEGDSSDLQATLAGVRQSLEATEEDLDDVAEEADDAGDELTALSVRATSAAGGLTALSGAAGGTQSTLTGLRTTFQNIAAVGGVLATGTLPAVAAAISAVGAAASGLALGAGGVLGLSAAAAGAERLKRDLAIVRQNIVDLARVTGQRLGLSELLSTAIRSLDDVVASTLAEVSNQLPAFARALRTFGSEVAAVIPGIADALLRIGRQALPVLTNALSFLRREGGDVFRDLLASVRELAPEVQRFVGLLVRNGPQILRLSTRIADTFLDIANAVTGVVAAIARVSDAVAGLRQQFRSAGARLGEALVNGIIRPLNRGVNRIKRELNKLPGVDLTVAQIQPIDIASAGGGGATGVGRVPATGTMAPPGRRTDPGLTPSGRSAAVSEEEGLRSFLSEIATNTATISDTTASTASSSAETAMNTAATSQAMQNSAISGGPCDLARAIVGPLERVPSPRGSTAAGRQAVGSNARPVGPALDPGDATGEAGSKTVIEVDGEKLAETVDRAKERHGTRLTK